MASPTRLADIDVLVLSPGERRAGKLHRSWRVEGVRQADLDRDAACHLGSERDLSGLHLDDIDVEELDGVALEALTLRLVALDVRQARDAMPLLT